MPWEPKTAFDHKTAGRFLSPSEREILKRLEADDRVRQSERLAEVFQDRPQDVHLDSGKEEQPRGIAEGVERSWFGIALGCN